MRLLLLFLLLFACGQEKEDARSPQSDHRDVDALKKTVHELQGLQSQINALVMSDYATCKQTPTDDGSTNDALVRKICEIAQAATVEARVQMKSELATYSKVLSSEIGSIQDRLSTLELNTSNLSQMSTDLYGTGNSCGTATSGSLCARVTVLETSVSTLQSQMTSANSAISTLQTQVTTINNTLNTIIAGMVLEVTVGNENLSAGPLYESTLRKQDRSRVVAYVEDVSANVALGNNPGNATNGSATVTFTSTAHGLSAGNVIRFNGLTSGRGFSSAAVNDQYVIQSVPTANTFTIVMPNSATSGGTFGSSAGFYYVINGRGLGQAWQTSDDEAYKTTTASNKPYKFIITGASTVFTTNPTGASLPTGWGTPAVPGSGFICYSKSDRLALAATIKGGGSDIVCK